MDIEKYIADKMEEDSKNGFRTKYIVRSATGESPFGNKEIALAYCYILKSKSTEAEIRTYDVLDGTSIILNISMHDEMSMLEETFYSDIPYAIKLPKTVHTVEYGICRNTKLQAINLENVINIADEAFYGTRLTEVNLANIRDIGNGAFYDCECLKTATIGSDNSIPSTIVNIEDNAFGYCEKLEIIDLKTLVRLGKDCFHSCKALKTIDWERVCELHNHGTSTKGGSIKAETSLFD